MPKNKNVKKVLFTFIVLALLVGASSTQAALVMDSFTLTLTSLVNGAEGPLNPWGLQVNDQFSWYLVYDPATMDPSSGYINLASAQPDHQVRFNFSPDYVFNETEDPAYTPVWPGFPSAPYGYMNPGTLLWEEVYFSSFPGTFDYNVALMINPSGSSILFSQRMGFASSQFMIDLGLAAFDPATDRTAAPIPGAVWLLASGIVGLVGIKRKIAG